MPPASELNRFAGRVAVVTGAGSGLGKATAKLLAAEGGQVAAPDIAPDAAETTVKEIAGDRGTSVALRCDVSDPESVASTMSDIVSQLGPPAVVCNVAGIGKFAHTVDARFEDWQRILAVNLTGTFLM